MFPTDPILNYINFSFSKKINELAKIYAAEVTAAQQNFPSPGGVRLHEIMQPSVRHAKARVDSWIQIVRDACEDAKHPVDNDVRAFTLAEVHNLCDASRIHTAQALASTLKRESAEHLPGVRDSLSARLERQISQIESDVRQEFKLEELRENVQKSAKPEVSPPVPPKDLIPTVIPHIDNRPWYRKLSLELKIALWIGVPTLVLTGVAIVVMILLPELRIGLGLDREPKPDPKISIPAPRPPSDQPVPETPPNKESTATGQAHTSKTPAPTIQAIAPNGIANAAPNFGDQKVYNLGPLSRRITQQQRDEIVPMLSNDRARVIVWAYSTDTDTWGLAKDLYGALKDSGWSMEDSDVQSAIAVNPNGCDVAVFIPGVPGQPVTQLPGAPGEVLTALKTLGLTYGLGYSDKLGDATVKIVVGPR
jgi:hypothetical protein